MPNIFGEEEPEIVEANNRAHDLLKRMNNVVEELHSRYTDGFNRFGSEETGVVRLLLIFDELLNNETYDGNGWAFISTAVNTVEKAAPIIQKPLSQVLERRVPSDLESARLWIVYSLSFVDCMHLSLKAMWQLGEVVDAFYKRSSPIFATTINFKEEMLKLVQLLHHPRGSSAFTGGALEFNLDIGALSCFNTIFRSAVLKKQNNQNDHGNNNNNATATSSATLHQTHSNNTNTQQSQQNFHSSSSGPSSSLAEQHHQMLSQQNNNNNQATPITSTGNYNSSHDLSNLAKQNSAGAANANAAAGGGGKKVIRRVIKKKGGETVTSTTITSGGNYQDPSNNMDDTNYGGSSSPPPAHIQLGSGNNTNAPSVPTVQTESQTSLSFFNRQEKAVQVTDTTSSNNTTSTSSSAAAGATAGSSSTTTNPHQQNSASKNQDNNSNNNNKRSFDELQELDHLLTEREEKVKQDENSVAETKRSLMSQKRELETKHEELDQKLNSLANVADELKRLYNELFNVSEGGSKRIDESEIDKMIPNLVSVLNGKTSSAKVASTTNAPAKQQQQQQQQQQETTSTTPPVPSVSVIPPTPTTTNDQKQQQQNETTSSVNKETNNNNNDQEASNNTNNSNLPAPSPTGSRAGSFSTRRPMLPGANNNNNNNMPSNTSFSRPRAQTSVAPSTSTSTPSTSIPPTTNFGGSDYIKKNSSRLSGTGNSFSTSTTGNNNNNMNHNNNDVDETTTTNNQQQQNQNRASSNTTPEGSYNASPAHSPAPRTAGTRSMSEIDGGGLDGASGGGNTSATQSVGNASFASTAIFAKQQAAASAAASSSGIVTVAPDTCTTRPSQGIAYLIDPFEEPERTVQLKKQNNRCPKCGTDLVRNDTSNPLLRSIVNMGQLALQQKPRRCHYSGEIFCQKCHTNKVTLIPHKVCGSWDFEEYHVADTWFDYLGANFERPIIHLPDVELVAKRPVAQQLAQFRRKLNRMHAVLVLCPSIQKQSRSVFTTNYYFAREHWWSLADLVRMRLLENDAPSSLSRGLPNTELLQHLGRLMSEALDHINSCPSCRQKGYGVCTLCYSASAAAKRNSSGIGSSSSSPSFSNSHQHNENTSGSPGGHHQQDKVAFWEDGAACSTCGAIYHASCYELRGCPKCKK